MLKYLFPQIALKDVLPMFGAATVGALLAGAYGILNDEITYSISPEYFTKLKFNQFDYANFGLGDRVFVGTIGFLATWWVGFIVAWFLSRRLIPKQPRSRSYRQLRSAFACVFVVGLLFGTIAFFYGLWRGPGADYSHWASTVDELGITDTWAFVRVAYIRNAGYLGALIGLITALTLFHPNRDLVVNHRHITNG